MSRGLLPSLPGAGILLYSVSTAMLFHAAIWEPQNLRPSYWDFLQGISGGRLVITNPFLCENVIAYLRSFLFLSISCLFPHRVAAMSRDVLDVFGLESKKNLTALLIKNRTDMSKYKF